MSNYKELPKQHELNALFRYCEETGNLIRKVSTGPRGRAGDIAGCKANDGYISIAINHELYRAHRIIWVMVYGSIDSKMSIDHIDGNPLNNRIENLRLVTHKENMKNAKIRKDNKSGVMGVSWNKEKSKWHVRINTNGKQKHLGFFTNKKDAIKVRAAAEIECGFHENHGRD